MATFNKFNSFTTAIAAGTHANFLNANTDTLKVYLTNDAPSASADSLKADLAEIATGNGYTGPVDIQNAASSSGGVITVTAVDVTITATGAVGPFQYAVVYNDTPANDPLIGWIAYTSSISLANGESFLIDFGASLLTVG